MLAKILPTDGVAECWRRPTHPIERTHQSPKSHSLPVWTGGGTHPKHPIPECISDV